MANTKITELDAITSPTSSDVLPIVDVSAGATKKVTTGEIVGIVNGDVDVATDGTATISELPVSKLQDGSARQLLQTDAAGTGVEWTSDIALPGAASAASFSPTNSSVPANGMYLSAGTGVALSTSGTGRLFVDSDGVIALGSADSSTAGVEIGRGATGNRAAYLDLIGDTTYADYAFRIIRGSEGANANTAFFHRGTGTLAFNAQDAGNIEFYTTGQPRLLVRSDGKIGVGTSDPQAKVDINGQLRLSGGEDSQIEWINNSQQWRINNSITGRFYLYDVTNTKIPVGIEANTPSETLNLMSSGRVGLGTITPRAQVHVYGQGQATANLADDGERNGLLRVSDSGGGAGSGGGILFANSQGDTADSLGFAAIKGLLTNGNDRSTGDLAFSVRRATTDTSLQEAMRIFTDGNVAVGTSNSYFRFVAATTANDGCWLHNSTTTSRLGLGAYSSGTDGAFQIVYDRVAGKTTFNRGTRDTPSEVIQIDSTGKIGINGKTPAVALDVEGTINATASSNAQYFGINATGTGSGVGNGMFAPAGNTLGFSTGAQERMRIDNNGFIKFHTTASFPGSGNTDLGAVIEQSATGSTLFISRGDNAAGYFNRNSDGTLIATHRSGVGVGSISVTTTATAYNTSSDYRLKENVTAVTDGITRLQQLKPSRFNFTADPDKIVDGFLAHEVQDIVPEAVTGEKDAVDDEGNPEYQGIDQSKLVPLLTAALQEAIAKIEDLETRLAAAGL